ncbi:MAG: FlgD immunoglobulin-like domain containing protein [Candidatus Neomarinimicrobiota bacterium]
MKRRLLISSLVVLVFTGILLAQGRGYRGHRGDLGLTDEQQAQVHELVSGMRADGATREEIHAAVADLLAGWGIELPEDYGFGYGPQGPQSLMKQLTEEQRQQIHELVSGMRAEGASREEIHTALATLFDQWGLEWPPLGPGTRHQRHYLRQEQRQIRARNYPNPFNPDTRITYTLASPVSVGIQIYNLAGQLIWSSEMGYQAAGTYSVRWAGTDTNGAPAPTGVYFYRIQAGNEALTQRMLLMK